jgi:hypothetical protein
MGPMKVFCIPSHTFLVCQYYNITEKHSVNFRVYSATRFAFAHCDRWQRIASKRRTVMRTGTNHLFIPGPTNVPDDVRRR